MNNRNFHLHPLGKEAEVISYLIDTEKKLARLPRNAIWQVKVDQLRDRIHDTFREDKVWVPSKLFEQLESEYDALSIKYREITVISADNDKELTELQRSNIDLTNVLRDVEDFLFYTNKQLDDLRETSDDVSNQETDHPKGWWNIELFGLSALHILKRSICINRDWTTLKLGLVGSMKLPTYLQRRILV